MTDSYKILGFERLHNGYITIIEVRIDFIHNNSKYNIILNFEFDEKEDLYLFKYHSLYDLNLINFLVKDNVLINKNKDYYLNKSILLKLL